MKKVLLLGDFGLWIFIGNSALNRWFLTEKIIFQWNFNFGIKNQILLKKNLNFNFNIKNITKMCPSAVLRLLPILPSLLNMHEFSL